VILSYEDYNTVKIKEPRRSTHRGTWNKPDNRDDSNQMALSWHNTMFYGILLNKPHAYDSCSVTFVEHPGFYSLDTCEDNWLN